MIKKTIGIIFNALICAYFFMPFFSQSKKRLVKIRDLSDSEQAKQLYELTLFISHRLKD